MAHNLAMKDGEAMLAYAGEKPWHSLGKELKGLATAEEMIKAAGLDWEVELQKVYCADAKGKAKFPVDGYKAVVRHDTGDVLSIVGDRYRPIQNSRAFGFFDAIIGAGEASYEVAGGLGKGERIWILAKLPKQLRVGKTDDLIDPYFLLVNTHDGTKAMSVFETPVRVVCQNTLSAALGARTGGINIRHTENATDNIRKAQEALGLVAKYYDDLEAVISRLSSVQINNVTLAGYVDEVFPTKEDAQFTTRTDNIRDEVTKLFDTGRGNQLPGVKGTPWAAYNAVTQYVDWERSGRGKTPEVRANNRLNSIWFGSGAQIKAKAWDSALKLVGIAN